MGFQTIHWQPILDTPLIVSSTGLRPPDITSEEFEEHQRGLRSHVQEGFEVDPRSLAEAARANDKVHGYLC